MGRRKIEIQPITHERNRSVTFLKRKNGLFKKAYELGVLCSVDVAVIIFEERPGHHAKLYQYCSTDVNAMVQRHLRFEGERDTKGPADFSNNSNNKAEDAGDDDDEGDDDDSSQKRRDSSKSKVKVEGSAPSIVPIRPGPPSTDISTSPELDYRSNLRVSPTASTSSSSLPISGERHTSAITSAARSIPISSTAKRPRLTVDDPSHGMQSAPATLGANSNHIGSPTFPYRLDIDLPYSSPGGSSIIPSLSQLHSQHPSLTALYSGGGGPSTLSNLMSGGGGSSFLPQSPFDLSRGHNAGALRTVTFPPAGSSPYSPHSQHRQQQQQSPSLFSRGSQGQQQHHSHGGSHGHASASNIFADLLGSAGEHGNGAGHAGAATSQFPTFDWPVHAASQTSQQGGQGGHENAAQGSPTDNNWFDFLSAPTSTSNGGGGGGGGVGQNAAGGLSLSPPVPPLSSSRYAASPGLSRKRLRDEGNGASDSGESDEQGRRERPRMNGNGGGGDGKS
ncbi:hypothetical protein BV20DRAFT_1029230 [Pilatotrama ljubarskyi]|nr:hypothetical protein BV20DRAFT_1029230 [Pilatotrama ljubarskyi]